MRIDMTPSPANILSAPSMHTTARTAPSRALSPVRSMPPLTRMPSPLSSPTLRPSSPLSIRPPTTPFDAPQPRSLHSHPHARAPGNSSRRANSASLKLPSLPRFHPSNYPSGHQPPSSLHPTPPEGPASPPGAPSLSRAHQRNAPSDAQRQLFMYQRDVVSAARAASPGPGDGPRSPRLAPLLGSPGPVTPLELAAHEGYLMAGARGRGGGTGEVEEGQLVERLIWEEAVRRRGELGREVVRDR
ncbi:hypothetical protein LTR53_014787 [Teratosphaeriaceae sp. CCFEE 6253]|nr:hypothetical protein LTR53_014787 [Teratosphaeriaceae sp. CCFEE 6253]